MVGLEHARFRGIHHVNGIRLGAGAEDGDALHAQFVGHDEGVVNILHAGGDGHIDRRGARAGDEGLEGAQHQHMAGGGNGADAVAVGGGAVKDRQILLIQPRNGFNMGGPVHYG